MAVHLAAAFGWSRDAAETQDSARSRRRRTQAARLVSGPASCGPASRPRRRLSLRFEAVSAPLRQVVLADREGAVSRMELVPRAFVLGAFMPPAPPGQEITVDRINRIWADVAGSYGFVQLQLTPDRTSANFLGATHIRYRRREFEVPNAA